MKMTRLYCDCIRWLSILATLAVPALADGLDLDGLVQASAESAAVRLESRSTNTTARALVCGVEYKAAGTNEAANAWDTTTLDDGWQTFTANDAPETTAKLLVRNDKSIAVEGGRLQSSVTWTAEKTHIVRNWVIVPDGVTLTIGEGTVVKFGELTGIKVESGGALNLAGTSENRCVMTTLADDTFGNDIDLLEAKAVYGGWSVTANSGGTINDVYTHVRYGTVGTLPTLSMPASVTAQRTEGKARIPVTLSGTRSNRMSLHWKTIDGTAKYGTDFTKNEDEAVWANTSSTTVYFEIPLVTTSEDDEVKTFLVELVSVEDANPNPQRLTTTVTIISGTSVPIAVSAESPQSAAVRLENRGTNTVGRALVHGTEYKAANPESAATAWDTTTEPEGWKTFTAGTTNVPVLVRNDKSIAIEGGRLLSSVTWSSDKVHLVRNQVVVPSGVTLTIGEGAVVKFCEVTGIKVEDGGAVVVAGKDKSRAVLTTIEDDAFGGNSDLRTATPANGSWSIETVGSGSVSDVYTYVRYGTVASLPTVSMPVSATAQRSDGKVRIPVTLSGTRSNRMSIHWRAVEGTAKLGTDYTETEGEAVWANTSSTTVYFEVPIIAENASDEVKTFEIELVSAEDVNVNPNRLVTKVMIVSGSQVSIPTCASSESSEAVRLEARGTNTLGHAIVVGTEWKAADGASRAETWDTTPFGYSWQTLEDGHGTNVDVLAMNDAAIAVEGGRLTANAVEWSSNTIHVVRNWVVIPSGATLTVTTNAVVKFCESTGIKVEAGGSLIVKGVTNAPALFTTLADDTAGGDTDKREGTAENGQYAITVVSGGTFTDSNASFRHVVISSHATLSLPTKCEINESEKQVQIPITLSGSRSTPFRVYWRVLDGTATYPDDFLTKAGVVEWNSSSDSTRYITLPVNDDGVEEETENFTVELYDAQGANISGSAYLCVVTVRDSTAAIVPYPTSAESEACEPIRLENRAEGMLGKAVVYGTEYKAAGTNVAAEAWDTTAEAEGWQMLTASDAPETTAKVLVRNDSSIAIEGGRLQSNTIWSSNVTHLVRHTVVVPSGVTLSVTTNAVVKFCENTGVKVEAGGRFQLLGSLEENVYMTLANDDTVGGDTDQDENRDWVESASTYAITVVSGGTFTDMNSVIRGTTIGTFGYASVNAKTIVDATDGKIRIPVFVNGSRSTQFSVDWKTSDGHKGQLVWSNVSQGTKWVVLDVTDCAEKFTFELCECRGINIDSSAKTSEVTVFKNATPLATCAESESSEPVRFENRAVTTFGGALCFGTEWKSADAETRAEAWDTTQEANDWVDLGSDMKLLVRNDSSLAIEGGRLQSIARTIHTNDTDITVYDQPTWGSNKVHIVRNWVVIPNGVTLTIQEGTVVKFAEYTGFKVENGGRLLVSGTVDAPVVYTAAADDTIGGDSDKRETEPQYGDYSINIVSGGSYVDNNCAIRYATFSNLGTATLPEAAIASEKQDVVRIPLFISTSRTTAFCVDWRVASGPYVTKGRVNWTTYKEGTQYITIPLTVGTVQGEFDTFEIELYESQGINISTTARKCTVKVYPDTKLKDMAFADSESSEGVRLENRDPEYDYGAVIVTGTELKSATGEEAAEAWDTTAEQDGWKDVSDGEETLQLLVRNDPSIAIEGGRLQSTSVVWSNAVVHVVRNWVVVPSGCALTIRAGSVVKFCEDTGILVEKGGRLNCAGTTAADVIFTSINDDTVGGDTDLADEEPEFNDRSYYIDVVSGGTFSDTYTQMRYGESETFGSVSIAQKVVAKKDGGVVRIPITISTSRTTPFAVDWVAYDDGAVYDEDYLCASGRVYWTSSTQGTQFLEIPLDRLAPSDEDECFAIELITGLGINLNLDRTYCEIELYDTKDALVGENQGYAESEWCEFSFVKSVADDTPIFADSEEIITYSTKWRDEGALATVFAQDAEGNSETFVETEGEAEDSFTWNSSEYDEGRYTFTHKILNGDGNVIKTDKAIFIVNRDITRHAGTLVSNEVWDASTVHLVTANVIVPSGLILTIEPQAVVKFLPGTRIIVQSGATGICSGAVFTHAYDDTVGGDTFFDGAATSPADGCYSLDGTWISDATTEYRYSMPIEVGGTISKNTHWVGYKTYLVTGNITINSGVTLTIDAGAVIKFKGRYQVAVNSGATLLANGTRSAPIVFTSFKDDEHGGDSNGDGDASEPGYGDWLYVWVYGRADLNYTQLMYAAPGNERGIVMTSGGTLNMDGCLVAHAEYDGVWNWGGTIKVKNTVFFDCGNAACPYRGSSEYVNCVMMSCNYGFMDWSHWYGGTFKNCIFYGCGSGWCDTSSSNEFFAHSSVRNCCFYNPDEYSIHTCTKDGVDGCFYADPGFADPELLDLRIDETSPCVDAGDGAAAPEMDYYGQPRQTLSTVVPTGTPSANGKYPDIGIYEVLPRFVEADVDLELTSIVAPETLTVGESATVSWTVKNVGTEYATGQWVDKVELICANGNAVTLGTKLISGGIAPGGSRTYSASWTVPAGQEGAVRVRVTTNANRDLFEGSLMDNNRGDAAEESELVLPEIELVEGGVVDVSVAAESDTAFRLGEEFVEGGLVIVHSSAPISIRTGSGQVPTADIFYAGAVKVADGTYIVRAPANENAYITFANETSSSVKVEVEPEFGDFQLFDTGVVTAPNTGKTSLTLFGNGFDESVEIYLEGGGKSVRANDVAVEDAVKMVATFDVDGLAAGTYRVRLVKGDDEVSGEALTLTQVTIGPKWTCKLILPDLIRAGRTYIGYVEYVNSGDVALKAPYVRVEAGGGTKVFKDAMNTKTSLLEFLAISETYPYSMIKPGESIKYKFNFMSEVGSANITLAVMEDEQAAVLWDENLSYMRPYWADDDTWNLTIEALKKRLGNTWSQCLDVLRHDCDVFGSRGQIVSSFGSLLQCELAEAFGLDSALTYIEASEDLNIDACGMDLSLGRYYRAGMCWRRRANMFGRGWVSADDIVCHKISDGVLIVSDVDGQDMEFRKVGEVWKLTTSESSPFITMESGNYKYDNNSGVIIVFSSTDGRVLSQSDVYGHSIVYSWENKKLLSKQHSDGHRLDYVYDNLNHVVCVNDNFGHSCVYQYNGDLLASVTRDDGFQIFYSYVNTQSSGGVPSLSKITYLGGMEKTVAYENGMVSEISCSGGSCAVLRRNDIRAFSYGDGTAMSDICLGINGEILSRKNNLGQLWRYKYTQNGLLESVVDSNGQGSRLKYDANGHLTDFIGSSGATIRYVYSSQGLLTSFVDPCGNDSHYQYNAKGSCVSVSMNGETKWTGEFTEEGNVTVVSNARKGVIKHTYDRFGRKVRMECPDGRMYSWAYDSHGNCTNAYDTVTGEIKLQYNSREQLVDISYPKGRGFKYYYDKNNRLSEVVSYKGQKRHYAYDVSGRIVSIDDGAGCIFVTNVFDYATGGMALQKYGNGASVSNHYDIAGRIDEVAHYDQDNVLLARYKYHYDYNGRVVCVSTINGDRFYEYDVTGQIVKEECPDSTIISYRYDASGNRIVANGVEYEVGENNQYLSIRDQLGITYLKYDADGNLIAKECGKDKTTYYYDCNSRLVAVTNDTKGIHWQCAYDAIGNRVLIDDNGVLTECVYSPGCNAMVEETYRDGALETSHINMFGWQLAKIGGGTTYYHGDGCGNVVMTTTKSCAVNCRSDFGAFGEELLMGTGADSGCFVGMTGAQTDSTGLVFMRNRYYDPMLGRFIQMDPLGVQGESVNYYCYCKNAPVLRVDPDGLRDCSASAFFMGISHGTDPDDPTKSITKPTVGTGPTDFGGSCSFDANSTVNRNGDMCLTFVPGVGGSYCRDEYDNSSWSLRYGFEAGLSISGKSDAPKKKHDFLSRPTYISAPPKQYISAAPPPRMYAVNKTIYCKKGQQCMYQAPLPGQTITVKYVESNDPNEILGKSGIGTSRYVKNGEWLDYTIYFENKSMASAAAQEIYVTLPKDAGLDWTSLELGEIAFGDNVDTGLDGKSSGECEYMLQGGVSSVRTKVTVSAKEVKWYLRSWVQGTTDHFPEAAEDGFLPPNNAETHCGEGHLRFRVKVRDDVAIGSVINASATIVFDTNDPIETDPAWWNTVGDVRTLALALGDGTTTNLSLVVGEAFGVLPEPNGRKGYAFDGWYTGKSGKGLKATPEAIVPTGLEALYDNWLANGVNVYVDGVRHACHYDDKVAYENYTDVTNGYTNVVCVGWVGTGDVPASGTGNCVEFTVTQESSLTWRYVTNYWVQIEVEKVGGGGDVGGIVAVKDAAGAAIANELWAALGTNLTAEATANEGWLFAGWYHAGGTRSVASELPEGGHAGHVTLPVTQPWLLEAVFTSKVFAVTFDLGEHGTRSGGGELVQTVEWGKAAAAPTVAAKAGYTFTKWDVAFDSVKSTLKVTAQYSIDTYNIAYVEPMGCENTNPTSYTVEDAITFSALTNPPGWKFLGWSPASIAKGTTGDKTVTAQWEQIKYRVDIGGVVDNTCTNGQIVTAETFAAVTNGYTNIVCKGWIGTGDVSANGTGNGVEFTVTQESTLTWLYATNYWVSVSAACGDAIETIASTCAGGCVAMKDAAGVAITNELWAACGTNLTAEATANEGWLFAGWRDVETGADRGADGVRALPVTQPWLLEAVFTSKVFVVTFDLGEHGMRSGGGELAQTVEWGKAAVAPTVATAAGWAFQGWDVAFDCVKSAIIVKAQYLAGGYTITYENERGCFNENPKAYTVEDEIEFVALTNAPGWKFVGWSPAKIERGSTGDTNIVARWEQIKYRVDIGGVVDNTCTNGQIVAAETFAAITNGYTNVVCVGWVGTGDVPASGTGNSVEFTVTQESTLNWLYATNYYVSVVESDGGSVSLVDVAGGAVPNPGWFACKTNLTAVATPDEGWRLERWGEVVWTSGGWQRVRTLGTQTNQILNVSAPWIVRAEFDQYKYDVQFDLGEHGERVGGGQLHQSVAHGASAVAPIISADNGYVFLGWDVAFDCVKSAITVTARYLEGGYTITYENERGCFNENPKAYTVEDEIEFVALSNAPGWKFLGWSPASIAKGTTGDKKVTAQWEQIKYRVDVGGVVDDTCVYGQAVKAETFATVTNGYTNVVCVGWVGTGDVPARGTGNRVEFTVTQASTLRWLYVTNYPSTVTFDIGAHGERTGGGELSQLVVWGGSATAPTVAAKTGYDFLGWDVDFDCVTSDKTVVAQYETKAYAISYVDTKGVANANPMQYTVEDALAFAPLSDLAEWLFMGWSPASIVKGTTGNQVVTAQWKKARNSILDGIGVTVSADNFSAITYDGYLFDEASGQIVGTVQVKAAKAKVNKKTGKTTSKLTISVQMAASTKKISISGEYDLTTGGEQTFTPKSGLPIKLLLGTNGLTGSYGDYVIEGVPNVFTAKDATSKAAANAANAKYVGVYNLIADEGSFSVSVMKKGKVKVTGTTTAGKSVSVSTQLIVGSDVACVPVMAPKYDLAFTVWFGDETTVDGMTDAVIGKTGNLASKSTFSLDVASVASALKSVATTVLTDYLPNDATIANNGKKWIVMPDANGKAAKAGKIVLAKDGSVDTAKSKIDGYNVSALKLTYTAKTGAFKGSFYVYTLKGTKLKKLTAKVAGIVVEGVGYGTATIKGAGAIAVVIK